MHDLTSPKWRGCIQCGYIYGPAHILEEPPRVCPDCGEALAMGLEPAVFGSEGALKLQKKYCKEHGIKRDWKDKKHPRIKDPPKPRRQEAEEVLVNNVGSYRVALLRDGDLYEHIMKTNYDRFKFPTKLIAYLALGVISNLIKNGLYDLARTIARQADRDGYLIMEHIPYRVDPYRKCPNPDCQYPDFDPYPLTKAVNDPSEDPVRCRRCQTVFYLAKD